MDTAIRTGLFAHDFRSLLDGIARVKTEEKPGAAAPEASPAEIAKKIKPLLPANPFVIPKEKAEEIKSKLKLTDERLFSGLIPLAKELARPAISKYFVGEAGVGESGNIYLGVNLEFPGLPPSNVVHGEQFFVVNALLHGEKELRSLTLAAAPCGHCRQFLNELGTSNTLKLIWPGQEPVSLRQILPNDFGPEARGEKGGLITPRNNNLREVQPGCQDSQMVKAALDAANVSYSPYRNNPSGVSIKTRDGKIYAGPYLENVAANPSLPPLQSALVALVCDGKTYGEITEVLLLEKKDPLISHEKFTRDALESIAPAARFHKGIVA